MTVPSVPQTTAAPDERSDSSVRRRELVLVLAGWFVLAAVVLYLAKENLSIPGLYYDEAIFGGMAKDFVTGHVHGQHLRGSETVDILGRPFPMFIQSYLGALKSWMLIPSFRVFGSSVPVLRLTSLFWGLLALAFFLIGAWRWLGLPTALFAGALLAFDPAFFFLAVLDWGAAIPSLFCRCVSFFLIVLWSQQRRYTYLFLAAVFAGLGFFNKVDFAVLLVAVGTAIACVYARPLPSWRNFVWASALFCAGFALGAGPMLPRAPGILALGMPAPSRSSSELVEKLHTLVATYDGSYFYRLMDWGGLFDKMYDAPSRAYSVFAFAFVIAFVALLGVALNRNSKTRSKQTARVLLLATVLVTTGVLFVPGAVRIHHSVVVFPLPQLIIATATSLLWEKFSAGKFQPTVRTIIIVPIALVLTSQLFAIASTQKIIRATGGSGRWSESINAFCRENKDRADLRIVSLDWGFNEQLAFLTERPTLTEPFWNFQNLPPLPADPDCIYLVHPPEYSLFRFGPTYLRAAQKAGDQVEIRPYLDRQNQVSFYAIQFKE
jgi:hypothetical protein